MNDLGSVNGVLVNNTQVQEFRLFDGDLIQIGHVKLRLFDPSDPSPRGADGSTASATSLARPAASCARRRRTPTACATTIGRRRARDEKSATFRSELHPRSRGRWTREDVRHRRPSVRIRIAETWETSSRFRYGIVIVAASLLGDLRGHRRLLARRLTRRSRCERATVRSSVVEDLGQRGQRARQAGGVQRGARAGVGLGVGQRASIPSNSASSSRRSGANSACSGSGARRTSASRMAPTSRRRRGSWWRKKSGTAPPSITPRA